MKIRRSEEGEGGWLCIEVGASAKKKNNDKLYYQSVWMEWSREWRVTEGMRISP